MINVDHAFTTTGETVAELFDRPGQGFYIPLYQRPYSWDQENVDQLTEDITDGVEEALRDDDTIRFLGTVITITVQDKNAEIDPKEIKGVPTQVDKVIDGQQRLSTIALLGTVLDEQIRALRGQLPREAPFTELDDAIDEWLRVIQDTYSLDLRRGSPERKPKVIRGQEDRWTYDGPDDAYQSPVASYLASYIRYATGEVGKAPRTASDRLVNQNIRRMRRAVKDVAEAHMSSSPLNGCYPSGADLVRGGHPFRQEYIWSYDRPEFVEMLAADPSDAKCPEGVVSALAQVFAFAHYLTQRCCVTLIRPSNEDWAFDMFQSLNATGTPLTAVETFKPRVVQFERGEGGFRESASEEHFDRIDSLMGTVNRATQKGRLTDKLLVSFALSWDGSRLANRFSEQRRWLQSAYEGEAAPEGKRTFTRRFADSASFFADVWEGYDGLAPLEKIGADPEAELTSTCLLYLSDANHNIAPAVLSLFYARVLDGSGGAVSDFVAATKAVTAFYTLWRSARSNSGLDAVYRSIMRGTKERNGLNWLQGDEPDVDQLRQRFVAALETQGIETKDKWLARVPSALRYDGAKAVCRFALFVAADDTVPDPTEAGLMKPGKDGCSPALSPALWRDSDLKEIEHVAPLNPQDDHTWDPAIYEQDLPDQIGNLTLLPGKINASAGNHGFARKLLYYQHLGLDDMQEIERLKTAAASKGLDLAEPTVRLLRDSKHCAHLRPITALNEDGDWNAGMIRSRTRRIAETLWDRLAPWIGS